MAASPLNLTIEQGIDFEITITVRNKNNVPLNLFGYTAVSEIKKHHASTTSYPFTVTFVDRQNGRISLSMSNNVTNTLNEGRHVYDIVLTSPNNLKTRVIQGTVLVSPGVS
jgi:hypothetical protein